jgi:hypothetical protein
MKRLAPCIPLLLLALTLPAAGADGEASSGPGWAGADLDTAQALAASSRRPVLVFTQARDCVSCDQVEHWLTADPQIMPLTEPYIRLRLSLDDPEGQIAATLLKIATAPTVLILGPDGMEATRHDGVIPRSWLLEQLQIIVRRHQPDVDPTPPDAPALLASMDRLLDWGDLHGAEQLRERLALTGNHVQAARQPGLVPEANLEIDTVMDLTDRLDRLDDPAELRAEAHLLALALEREGRAGMSLAAYRHAVERLTVDPLSVARAAYLAARQNLPLEAHLQRLNRARKVTPDSVAVLMAQARLAEVAGRLYLAYHAAEAAMVYAPTDAWVTLEYHRLRLLIRLRSRRMERDPA